MAFLQGALLDLMARPLLPLVDITDHMAQHLPVHPATVLVGALEGEELVVVGVVVVGEVGVASALTGTSIITSWNVAGPPAPVVAHLRHLLVVDRMGLPYHLMLNRVGNVTEDTMRPAVDCPPWLAKVRAQSVLTHISHMVTVTVGIGIGIGTSSRGRGRGDHRVHPFESRKNHVKRTSGFHHHHPLVVANNSSSSRFSTRAMVEDVWCMIDIPLTITI